MDTSSNTNHLVDALTGVADLLPASLVSEEDVKNKVVLPMLRALGYGDSDFNYEGHTGHGYVDVAGEQFPTAIIVETKAPRTPLTRYKGQLEGYVFDKHKQERTTLAILTDGELFMLYGVTGSLYSGRLDEHQVISFKRGDLRNRSVAEALSDLVGRQSNQNGTVRTSIESYRQKQKVRLDQIQAELTSLKEERRRIEARIQELEAEQQTIVGPPPTDPTGRRSGTYPAAPHILQLLQEHGAYSKTQAVDRKWLDDQLVHKADGVNSTQAVSFGLIQLKGDGQIEFTGGRRNKVWLKGEAPSTDV